VDNRSAAAHLWYSDDMNYNDEFVPVRIKRSVRAKAYKLAEKIRKETGKKPKLHEVFDIKFKE